MPPAFIYRILAVLVSILPLSLRAKIWFKLMRIGIYRWSAESKAQRIPGGMYIKYGPGDPVFHLNEGEVMRHVRSHSIVPVPIVVDNFTYDNTTYLVMSRLPGESLAGAYFDITPEVEHLLSAQLSKILASLRAIPAPSERVSGWNGSPVFCERIRLGANPAGPWKSVDDFHKALMQRALRLNLPAELSAAHVHDVIRRAHSRPHRVCLTHNDLGPHNVLVDDSWNITGIVDWEASAWMPEYWELTKGTFLPQYRKHRWYRTLTAALPMYALEQEAERYIINYRERYG